ncbi:MAG TPA: prepilin-type N-terminal cleavage/methylation domain-containing protein [Oligoflexus sp.]|uniref:pilus assembly FimT family protein n=1 Tax=Oligoflexus sp. TaxID=1971216 RepID=UPI002D3BC40A|nr:prepilin-type N-terminal cleavage/methylation domain-containing protein [Oligoflexus sp.]HYX39794.1 prepilin-type N-terminal cleavage/methylation domain-containing protein [Oligoflexus sp.]
MTQAKRRRPDPRLWRVIPGIGLRTPYDRRPEHDLPSHRARAGEGGFSLIEMIVVISLAALMFVVAAPSFTLSEETEATQKLNALAGDIRAAYDTTVLSRKPHRLVFAFGSGDYWLETTDRSDFYMGDEKLDRDPTPEEIKDRQAAFEEEFEQYKLLAGKEVEDSEAEVVVKPTSPLLAAKAKLAPAEWKAVENAEWTVRHLGPQFGVRSMQAEHHGKLQTFEELGKEGFVYLYFFPRGYVERAVIHIAPADVEDKNRYDERTYTVVTEPYEGLAEVSSGYQEVDLTRDEKAR